MMKYQKQLEEYIDAHERELVAATGRLVNIPSTKGEPQPGAPFGPGPAAALAEALKLAEEWGLTPADYDGYVGTVDVNNSDTRLHILCHLDVVDPGEGWDTDPYQMVEQDGILYGRGTDDDKGPAAVSLLALRAVKELGIPLKHNVRMILGTDEECGSSDIAYYYAREPYAPCTFSPDSCFPVTNIEKGQFSPKITGQWEKSEALPRVSGMTGGIRSNVVPPVASAVVAGMTAAQISAVAAQAQSESGVVFTLTDGAEGVTVQARGENAHAAAPDLGINAITGLLTLLCALPLAECGSTRAIRSLNSLFPHGDNKGEALGIAAENEESGHLTLTLSLLTLTETGLETSFNCRVPLGVTKESCEGVCRRNCAAHGFTATGQMREPHYVPADSPFVRTLLSCYENYSGQPGHCEYTGGGTYVHDIPGGVAFGAGTADFDSRLHAANERAKISNMLMAAKIYAQAIVELCGE